MSSLVEHLNKIRKRKKSLRLTGADLEFIDINNARRELGLRELICKKRRCIQCGKGFKSFDASHRVCDKCRPKWERKRNELAKAFVNIENTEKVELNDMEEINISD